MAIHSILNATPLGGSDAGAGAAGTLRPAAIAGAAFGLPLVRTDDDFLILSGWQQADFGSASVRNTRNVVRPFAFAPQLFGAAFIESSIRLVRPTAVPVSAAAIGTAVVQHAVRWLAVQPLAGSIGIATLAGSQALSMQGLESDAYGLALVHDTTQWAMAASVAGGDFGAPLLDRSPRILYPAGAMGANEGLQNGQWGHADLWNLRQILNTTNDPADPLGGIFGAWTEILNRNRTVAGYGLDAARYGRGANLYQGPVIHPAGWPSEEHGQTRAAYRVRTVIPDTVETAAPAAWVVVWNAAPVLSVAGCEASLTGQALVSNTRRWLDRIGKLDAAEFGTAFVDFGVRTVAVYYPPPPSPAPEPRISWWVQPLRPPSASDGGDFGLPVLEIHHTVIIPRWPMRLDACGATMVRNRTPELHPFGLDALAGGNPYIGFRVRPLEVAGLDQTVPGNTIIKDRRSWLQVQAIGAPSALQAHRVAHIPEPSYPQLLRIPPVYGYFLGNSTVNLLDRAYTVGGVAGSFGNAEVILYGIAFTDNGAYTPDWEQYGAASIISYRTVYPTGLTVEDHTAIFNPGLPRLSPDYLNVRWVVDSPLYGLPEAILKNRQVSVQQIPPHGFAPDIGASEISHRRRSIYPTPFHAMKRGYPILSHPYILIPQGYDGVAWGRPALAHYQAVGAQTAHLPATDSQAFGRPLVEGWIRPLAVAGFESTRTGEHPRVHPPEPAIPFGFDAEAFGMAMVDFKNRPLQPGGHEASGFGYVAGRFADKFTVKRGQPLFAQGFVAAQFGTSARVSTRPQFIGARGVAGIIGGARSVRNQKSAIQPWPCLYWPPPFGQTSIRINQP